MYAKIKVGITINIAYTFFLYLILTSISNCSKISYFTSKINPPRILTDTNNTTSLLVPFKIEYTYGECNTINCGGNLLCAVPNGKCMKRYFENNQTYDYKCVCESGYISYGEDGEDEYECCYKQKDGMKALLLEFLIGFGLGHLYLENYLLGMTKLSVYLLLSISSCFILSKMLKSNGNEKTFAYKVSRIICFLLCSCTYIAWQIVDCVLLSIGGIKDGNGADIKI